MIVFIVQWLALPTPCPLERTALGNTSPMYTQITAPCDIAKKAIYPISSHTSMPWCALLR